VLPESHDLALFSSKAFMPQVIFHDHIESSTTFFIFSLRSHILLGDEDTANNMPLGTVTQVCSHAKLIFHPSSHAQIARYKRATAHQRSEAATPLGSIPKSKSTSLSKQSSSRADESPSTFPAPLVLPGDELSWDPDYPAQSVRGWIREKDRNEVTRDRRVLYVVAPPDMGKCTEGASGWKVPVMKGGDGHGSKEERVEWTMKETKNVKGYLEAFYHGMEVRMLPQKLCFTRDVEEEVGKKKGKGGKSKGNGRLKKAESPTLWIDTHSNTGYIGIRTRTTPKGLFSHQLNLNDLLEVAIEILPEDAYALLMLVEHDIFEDEEDDFACGRAYGGSRVAVVSAARYNPDLDAIQGVGREHGWPASHCNKYMEDCVRESEHEDGDLKPKNKKQKRILLGEGDEEAGDRLSPMRLALSAHLSLPSLDCSPTLATLSGLWLARVCRTASHELGHCFGIDHCVYYACCMQGTASVVEDARQPPYLCPVDLVKVMRATGTDDREWCLTMREFCVKFPDVQLFAAFAAWLGGRIGEDKVV
jgi:archaemetzincin